jgi:hypothetical protein
VPGIGRIATCKSLLSELAAILALAGVDELRWNPRPPGALAVHVAVLPAPTNRHRYKVMASTMWKLSGSLGFGAAEWSC